MQAVFVQPIYMSFFYIYSFVVEITVVSFVTVLSGFWSAGFARLLYIHLVINGILVRIFL